ncbi:MAG TPA: hypothetical protein VHG08_24025 [Longimicrobium sp.]|nr:hypothetical protein [Longimicrobium sp.]
MWNPFSRKRNEPTPASAGAALPSDPVAPDRYDGRPLLILLESYVLAAIGELPAEKAAGAGAIVRRMWGGDEDWMRTLRRQLHLNDSVDDTLRRLWTRNQEIARENGVTLSPEQFSRMVCDQNFAHLL